MIEWINEQSERVNEWMHNNVTICLQYYNIVLIFMIVCIASMNWDIISFQNKYLFKADKKDENVKTINCKMIINCEIYKYKFVSDMDVIYWRCFLS